MKSIIIIILKFTTIVSLLFVAIVVIINTSPFDEELNQEIKKIMQDVPKPKAEGNAYYAMIGLEAQANTNINKAGHKIIARYLQISEEGYDGLATDAYNEILGQNKINRSDWEIEFDSCGSQPNMNCMAIYSMNLATKDLDKKSLQIMLNRYNDVINMTTFTHFSKINITTPRIKIGHMSQLSRIKLAMAYRSQFRSEFILTLYKDMKFWRMLINQETFLVDKIVALSKIKKNLLYLSEFIRNNPIIESDHHLINKILTPLDSKELSFNKNYIAESRAFFNFIDKIKNYNTSYENLIYQPNATKNTYYESELKNQLRISNLTLKNLIEEHYSKNNGSEHHYKIHYLYNFIGKTLIDFNTPKTTDYIVRGYDINNTITMVKIQFHDKTNDELTLNNLLSQTENVNTYTGKPFEYNKRTKQLHFKCLYRLRKCWIQL